MNNSKVLNANKDTFETEVVNHSGLVLLDFWAPWCGPCKALAPKLDDISVEASDRVKVVKVNVDENPEIAAQHGVRGIPAMIFYSSGKQVDQMVGNHPKESILDVIDKHASNTDEVNNKTEDFNEDF